MLCLTHSASTAKIVIDVWCTASGLSNTGIMIAAIFSPPSQPPYMSILKSVRKRRIWSMLEIWPKNICIKQNLKKNCDGSCERQERILFFKHSGVLKYFSKGGSSSESIAAGNLNDYKRLQWCFGKCKQKSCILRRQRSRQNYWPASMWFSV